MHAVIDIVVVWLVMRGWNSTCSLLFGPRGDFRIVGKYIISKEVHNESAIIELKCTNGFHILQNFQTSLTFKKIITYLCMSHKKNVINITDQCF